VKSQNNPNQKPLLALKYDVVFRSFFADEHDKESLTSFLKSVLRLPEDDYDEIEITDPHLQRDFNDDKLAIIDVKLRTKSKKTIHIEIQLKVTEEFRNRIVYYASKLITEQISDSDKYRDINRVISIVITDENFVKDSGKYHHRFVFADIEAGVELTDLVEFHTLELRKLPEVADGSKLYDWASFINAETEEELAMVTARNPEFNRTAIKLRKLSADEEVRDRYERRLKAERDKEMFEHDAEQRGISKGVVKGAKAEREKWQVVVADKDAQIAELQARLASLS
jgi:predicted transposase/invertase (TIGR01784 family)